MKATKMWEYFLILDIFSFIVSLQLIRTFINLFSKKLLNLYKNSLFYMSVSCVNVFFFMKYNLIF